MNAASPARAVLTGDLVASSKTAPGDRQQVLDRLRKVFDSVIRDTKRELRNHLDRFQIFRGDSFQTVLADPTDAIRVALLIRCRCLLETGLEIRLAVGIGAIEYSSPRSVGEGIGPAFTHSGHALDGLGKQRLVAVTDNKDRNSELLVVTALLDGLVRSWSKRSLVVAAESLLRRSQEKIGASLRVTQSAVSQRLAVAQWWAVDLALAHCESVVSGTTRAANPAK